MNAKEKAKYYEEQLNALEDFCFDSCSNICMKAKAAVYETIALKIRTILETGGR